MTINFKDVYMYSHCRNAGLHIKFYSNNNLHTPSSQIDFGILLFKYMYM